MIREGGELRVKVGTGEIRSDSLWVEIQRELIEHLDDWSAPVRCKIDNGVLVFRRSTPGDDAAIHIGRKADDERWPKRLPGQPLPTPETGDREEGSEG